MSRLRSILVMGSATLALAFASTASAQQGPGPVMRVWEGEQPYPEWNVASASATYVGHPVSNLMETQRIETAADYILRNYPKTGRPFGIRGFPGSEFQPRQSSDFDIVGVMLRTTLRDYAFGGGCGSSGDSSYLTVPAEWFDGSGGQDWPTLYPELSIGVAIGWRQMQGLCQDVLGIAPQPDENVTPSPLTLTLNGLGAGLGLSSLDGSPTRYGETWGATTLTQALASHSGRLDGDESLTGWSGLMRRFGGMRRIDRPLFEVGEATVADGWFWAYAGASREWDFITPLLSTSPSQDTAPAIREWLDSALRRSADDARGLSRGLATINWNDLVLDWQAPTTAAGSTALRRDIWQAEMVTTNASPGCAPVLLSLSIPSVELSMPLAEAATNCIVVEWQGAGHDPELPPSFSVIAEAPGHDASALDALYLSADQDWTQSLDVVSGGSSERFEVQHTSSVIRPGLIVEDVRSGQAVKSWEVLLRPDAFFDDGRMTVALTNYHPDGENQTRPMNLRLTIGAGAHEVRQNLRGATVPEDGDPCAEQRGFTPNVARQYAMPVANFHVAALDPDDFSINGFIQTRSGQPSLQQRMIDCSRVQVALGFKGPGAGRITNDAPEEPGSPASVCAGQMSEITSLGAQMLAGATGGNLEAMSGLDRLSPRQIDFDLVPRGPITGPGTYPADASAGYQDLEMEDRGVQLPSSSYGEGSITVEHAGAGLLRVSYEARFEPQECSAYLAGTISGELETVVALPMLGSSNRAHIGPRPIDLFGDDLWRTLPLATRRQMQGESRRAEPDGVDMAPPPTSQPGVVGIGQCGMSPEEARRYLEAFVASWPSEARAQFMAQLNDDPESTVQLACIYKETMQ